ncbi:hypothetical protein EYR36_011594 [Pleurotus pulmonarius]|nr:hypothetical protein EYR36_011594 [Pleurotus pulmonarius]
MASRAQSPDSSKPKIVALPSLASSLSSLPQAKSMAHVALHPNMYAQRAAESEAKVSFPSIPLFLLPSIPLFLPSLPYPFSPSNPLFLLPFSSILFSWSFHATHHTPLFAPRIPRIRRPDAYHFFARQLQRALTKNASSHASQNPPSPAYNLPVSFPPFLPPTLYYHISVKSTHLNSPFTAAARVPEQRKLAAHDAQAAETQVLHIKNPPSSPPPLPPFPPPIPPSLLTTLPTFTMTLHSSPYLAPINDPSIHSPVPYRPL